HLVRDLYAHPKDEWLTVEVHHPAGEQVRLAGAVHAAKVPLHGGVSFCERLFYVLPYPLDLYDDVCGGRSSQRFAAEAGDALELVVPAHEVLSVHHVEDPGQAVEDRLDQALLLLELALDPPPLRDVVHEHYRVRLACQGDGFEGERPASNQPVGTF